MRKRIICWLFLCTISFLFLACQSEKQQLKQVFSDAAEAAIDSEDPNSTFLDAVVAAVHKNPKLGALFEDGSYESLLTDEYAASLPDLSRIVPIAASWERQKEDNYYRYPVSCEDEQLWSTLKSGEPEYVLTIPAYVSEDVTDEELMLLLMSCPEQFAWSEISSVSPVAYVAMNAETSAAWKRIYDADAINVYAEKNGLMPESARTYEFPGCEGRALENIQKNFSSYLRDQKKQ